MKVKKRIYRFRFLNASLSRSLPAGHLARRRRCTWSATDGGLMPKSQTVSQWRHGSAERYEVLIDFSKFKAGQRIELKNLSNPNNRDFDNTNKIMAFDVVDDAVRPERSDRAGHPADAEPGQRGHGADRDQRP